MYGASIKILVNYPIIYLFWLSILYLTFALWLMLNILECITIRGSQCVFLIPSKYTKTKSLFIEYAIDS